MARLRVPFLLALASAPALAQHVLLEDTFSRPDGSALGANWAEYALRGDQAPSPGDTPWSIRGGALTFSATGEDRYVEDFVATAVSFPVEGTRVEFDLRATVGTLKGYVGPAVLWVDDPARKRGSFNLAAGGSGPIGLGVSYRWENKGTGGALLFAGAGAPAWHEPDRAVPGVNQDRFVRHALTVRDGFVTWEAGGTALARVPLAQPLPPGARRRLLVTTRIYDSGRPQAVEVRNLRILGAAGGPTSPPPGPAGDTFVEASAPPSSRAALAVAVSAATRTRTVTVIEAAASFADVANDRNHWRIFVRASAPGTYPDGAVTFNASPAQAWLGQPCTVTLTRVDAAAGGVVEGRFDCTLQAFNGEARGADVRSSGSFRARVEP